MRGLGFCSLHPLGGGLGRGHAREHRWCARSPPNPPQRGREECGVTPPRFGGGLGKGARVRHRRCTRAPTPTLPQRGRQECGVTPSTLWGEGWGGGMREASVVPRDAYPTLPRGGGRDTGANSGLPQKSVGAKTQALALARPTGSTLRVTRSFLTTALMSWLTRDSVTPSTSPISLRLSSST